MEVPAGLCWVLVDVGVDGEATGTVGEAWGGVNRRRRAPGSGGCDLQIGATPALIG